MTHTEAMTKFIEELIDSTPADNNGGVETQVTLRNGMALAGVLVRKFPGCYGLRTLLRKGDARSGPVEMVDMYFTADDVSFIVLPVAKSEQSGLVTASGEPVLAKPRMQ